MEGAQGGDGLGDQDGPFPHRQGALLQVRIKTSQVGTTSINNLFNLKHLTLLFDRGVERIGELQDTTIIVRKEKSL